MAVSPDSFVNNKVVLVRPLWHLLDSLIDMLELLIKNAWEILMKKRVVLSLTTLLALLLLLASFVPGQTAAEADHWVATWGAAMQQASGTGYENQTLRMFVRASLGGRSVRVRLSNAFGSKPLTLGPVHLALHAKDSGIVADSDRELRFGGEPSVTIAPGASSVSDAVSMEVAPLADLAISIYAPVASVAPTRHSMALRTGYIAAGNQTVAATLTNATTMQAWCWISGVEVMAPANAATIVAFGASSVDGATSTVDANRSWPSVLAERLQADAAGKSFGVVNMGISGNKVLGDSPFAGTSALARLDRDALDVPGARWLMLFEGTNDIGATRQNPRSMTLDDLTGGYKQIVERAHKRGIKVIGCTLNPFEGMSYYSEQTDSLRNAVNNWIRTSGIFDAVADFEAATRDPENPKQILPRFNNGDHLHPNDAGYKAMAESINLTVFQSK
jgi:lysophospholipase L1-like esterase